MLAVIETGGKQYTVKPGTVITIEKIPDLTGDNVVFSRVLLTSDGNATEIGMPFLETTVEGKVLDSGRGDKIRVYKMHAKKRYQRTQGHRQDYMKVEITAIGGKAGAAKASKMVKKETPATTKVEAKAPKVAPSKKAAVKKAPAAKKPAAKKAPAKKAVK